ncbi:VOC family protein [Criblamydia sequanensis]|uniref:3-demethylubiquinone-9 3-methyltransferase n=1 Tax=Candidatus Criblamydia sequanensis CRIB-18 TaxID=1437425 RepID=A0A090DYH8_9BACT|nr:VOC family protein [Criblamydia sequanensis]CDR33759.1 Putative 3-demethylubiquinone-9 3-methyltransferase [Criblamydia sequanensis CRIB-18]
MQKIIPHLWFDKEAVEAAHFYTSVFPNSKVTFKTVIKNTPSGDCDIVRFNLSGYEFQSISAGPLFKFNPTLSFMLNFDPSGDKNARKVLDGLWERLSEGGKILMPLDTYPFSERYGWLEDRYGVSWQLILTNPEGEKRPFIIPSFLFVRDVAGKAEEAIKFYSSVFNHSHKGMIVRYPKGMEPNKEGTIMFADFTLENQWFAAMDSADEHNFGFNEAISFMVNCKNQKEIDVYFEKLSAVPKSEQCGWIKDKFGVSWQIVPENMEALMAKNPDKTTPAMLKMKKIIIKDLENAGEA